MDDKMRLGGNEKQLAILPQGIETNITQVQIAYIGQATCGACSSNASRLF